MNKATESEKITELSKFLKELETQDQIMMINLSTLYNVLSPVCVPQPVEEKCDTPSVPQYLGSTELNSKLAAYINNRLYFNARFKVLLDSLELL